MDSNEIEKAVRRIASIGQDSESGAVNRIFGSKALEKGQDETERYFRECGMEVWKDSTGNIHGLYAPASASEKELFIGSHIDTVREGGMFDGVAGVVCAAECVRRLREEQVPLKCRIHALAMNGEESNPFGGLFGSRAMMGLLDTEDSAVMAHAKDFGYTKEDFQKTLLDTSRGVCYLELHIEQGNTLWSRQEAIGVVTGIVGIQTWLADIQGISNHAGTTMMEDRKDAMIQAARVILLADTLVKEYGHRMVATVGNAIVHPGAANVISDHVRLTMEFRGSEEDRLNQYVQEFQEKAKELADISFAPVDHILPTACDERIIQAMDGVCREKGLAYRQMPSGAGHDGQSFAGKLPIGMLFVPSKDGISHSRKEWTDWSQLAEGIEVMYKTVKVIGEKGTL